MTDFSVVAPLKKGGGREAVKTLAFYGKLFQE